MSCPNCIEKYNKSTRKEIECVKCKYKCCVNCVKHHLIGSSKLPHCMNCKIEWNDERLRDIVSNSWITGDYAPKRKDLLFDIEKALLPDTMGQAEKYLFEQKLVDDKRKLAKEFFNLKCGMLLMNKCISSSSFLSAKKQIDRLKLSIMSLEFLDDVSDEDVLKFSKKPSNEVVAVVASKQFIKQCPEKTCKGYLSTQYNCGLCKCKVCPTCLEIKLDEHVCIEENILTAELIKKETKNCPSCGTNIFKISGCDQMWCTSCNTGFGWRNGKVIENTAIHNPHFFQWQQTQTTQHVQQNDCIWAGPTPDMRNIVKYRHQYIETDISVEMFMGQIMRSVIHIHAVKTTQPVENYVDLNKQHRINYLINEIDITKFKNLCLKTICQQDFDIALNMLYVMLRDTCRDIINSGGSDGKLVCIELKNLIEYYNIQILAIHNKYKRSARFILLNPKNGANYQSSRSTKDKQIYV